MSDEVAELRERLETLDLRAAHHLGRRLEKAHRQRDAKRRSRELAALSTQIEQDHARAERRRAAVPPTSYPPQLPITERRDDIVAAIAANQVVIVAGETGSGKTTQLPKLCLDAGRGTRGRIGHTQPRRIAARSVAERIASELGVDLGGGVGYAVRFTDEVGEDTTVKVMTDGILLAEIQRDPMLWQYDTIIIDEAHERSLTIDFVLGFLRALLPRRPDLKLIVTSATIDPQRFADYFGGAPVIEVSGRTFPVEIRYRPLVAERMETDDGPVREPMDQLEGIIGAVRELTTAGPGDILVFLSGEREIRDTADALRELNLPATEVLALYARLSAAEQHRVFTSHIGRRIVLATNVAETSLTVPGIRYVIDPGTARISRYSHRTKVQRLPIEAVSQASAMQRSGRCGRVAAGICIRLYAEEDFEARPEFTEPEILRTSLAAVILQMAALRLGDIAAFDFLDAPDRRSIRDGVALLTELGALETDGTRLTPIGRSLAQLPIDPRLARMVVAAAEEDALADVLVIVAGLSIQDPRERPIEEEEKARLSHARFSDDHSDFDALLNLWRYLGAKQAELSGNQFRRLCRSEYLHYLRIREWQDLVVQLRRVVRTLGLKPKPEPADSARIHAAVLTGLLSQIGAKDGEKREYTGVRNTRFVIAPGSALAKKPPRWVMAAELVETSRLYARMVARIDPETIERVAAGQITRSYSEPRWDARRGAARATERVTLFGLTLIAGRTVDYARIDPELSRELFIRHALVDGDWTTHHAFAADNRALLLDVADVEERLRRRDVLADEEVFVDFFKARIPADVVSVRHFDRWWKQARRDNPRLLDYTRELVLVADAEQAAAFPDRWTSGAVDLPLSYRFSPGAADDGITVHIPLDVLNRVDPDAFDWHVPARREELVTALIRSLPKDVRRQLGPAPDRARAIVAQVDPGEQSLLAAIERAVHEQTGVVVARTDWDLDKVPEHLRPRFVIEDGQRRELASGRELHALRDQLAQPLRDALAEASARIERTGLVSWDLDEVPRTVEQARDGRSVIAYPALLDEGDSVALRVLPAATEQEVAMRAGVRRLLLLTVAASPARVAKALSPRTRLALSANPDGSLEALIADCLAASVDATRPPETGGAWNAAWFAAQQSAVRAGLGATLAATVAAAEKVVTRAREVDTALGGVTGSAQEDLRHQRARLLAPGFVLATGADRLGHLERYLHAMIRRIERQPRERDLDAAKMERVHRVEEAYAETRSRLRPGASEPDGLVAVAAMIEELRVSLFAQTLGTAYPISEQRIYRALDALHI